MNPKMQMWVVTIVFLVLLLAFTLLVKYGLI